MPTKTIIITIQIFIAFLFTFSVGGAVYLAGFENTLPFYWRLFLAAAFAGNAFFAARTFNKGRELYALVKEKK